MNANVAIEEIVVDEVGRILERKGVQAFIDLVSKTAEERQRNNPEEAREEPSGKLSKIWKTMKDCFTDIRKFWQDKKEDASPEEAITIEGHIDRAQEAEDLLAKAYDAAIRAHEEKQVNVNPSEAQKEAGNYRMGHIKVDGMDVTIENPKGSVRRGTDADGTPWEVAMNYTYGYIRGTKGVDGDHIDLYLSDAPEEGNVYVVDQIDQKTGAFDEHKVMYGFKSMDEARQAYLSQYQEGWKVGTITEVSKEDFKKWVESSTRKTKPFIKKIMHTASQKKNGSSYLMPLNDLLLSRNTIKTQKSKIRKVIVYIQR